MARLGPQRARKLAKSAQSHESIDSLEVARGVTARAHSVKFELGASLTTNTAVCPVGGTVPTTPIIGNDLLTEPNEIPDPPVSSHGSHQRRRRRSVKRWAESRRCVAGCICPSDSDGDEEPRHGIVGSDDEEDVPDTPAHLLSGLQAKRRKERQERERAEEQRRSFLEAIAPAERRGIDGLRSRCHPRPRSLGRSRLPLTSQA